MTYGWPDEPLEERPLLADGEVLCACCGESYRLEPGARVDGDDVCATCWREIDDAAHAMAEAAE